MPLYREPQEQLKPQAILSNFYVVDDNAKQLSTTTCRAQLFQVLQSASFEFVLGMGSALFTSRRDSLSMISFPS